MACNIREIRELPAANLWAGRRERLDVGSKMGGAGGARPTRVWAGCFRVNLDRFVAFTAAHGHVNDVGIHPMTDDEWRLAERDWHDAKNWRLLNSIYVAPQDPRVWVRKRKPEFGWTVNFAHIAGWLWAAAIVGLPVAALIVLLR